MKKYLSVLLAVMLLFLLSACTGNTDAQTDAVPDTSAYVPVCIRIKLPRQIKNFPARLIISYNTGHNKAVKMRRKTKEAH